MVSNFFDFYPHEKEEDAHLLQVPEMKQNFLIISERAVERLVYESFKRLSFTFTRSHIDHLIKACLSPDASDNDRYVLASLLKNAQCSSDYILPLCQDTGIAHTFAWIPQGVVLSGSVKSIISSSVYSVYKDCNLRYSTSVPLSFYEEKDPQNNLPCQTYLFSEPPSSPFSSGSEQAASFLFCAKGGGSSNKTVFIQGTKADLTEEKFVQILEDKIRGLGTSACPPYTIAAVAGGLSPEQNLLTLKLATCGYISNEKDTFRDEELEKKVLDIAHNAGYGAQFGGTQAAVEAVVIRLPRHGASCPISIGVSCSAHRNLKAFITKEGIYLEKTVSNLEELDGFTRAVSYAENKVSSGNNAEAMREIKTVSVNTEDGIEAMLSSISQLKPGSRILLSGSILVARDAAHARWKKLIDEGKELPPYTVQYPVCYAGPSRTPDGLCIGSFGPTTAGRMDSYAELLMSRNAERITLAKGNRSPSWKEACKKYNSCYLGTIGGAAALITNNYITSSEVIDYDDLGMEAVRLVTVKNLPVFMLINGNGEDFYDGLRNT